MPAQLAKLAAAGAYGAIALFSAVYALVVWITLPRRSSGMTPVLDVVTWISLGLVVVALAVVHVVIARQLQYLATRRERRPV